MHRLLDFARAQTPFFIGKTGLKKAIFQATGEMAGNASFSPRADADRTRSPRAMPDQHIF